MNTAERPLRSLVGKWLTSTAATPIRVTRFSRTGSTRGRYVRVDAQQPEGSVGLFFFRHDNGTLQVFPPATGG
ncbi:hypothetical protein PQQ88_33220 [Paraburkholderia caledonica]